MTNIDLNILLQNCRLFNNMSIDNVKSLITCSKAILKKYKKGSTIFSQGDEPEFINILLKGQVIIANNTVNGNQNIISMFDNAGDMFGEVFLFSFNRLYENFAYAEKDCDILCIPKRFLYSPCNNSCQKHNQVIANMLCILADKAYFLNQRVQILSCNSLRAKLIKLIFQYTNDDIAKIPFGREQLAAFLGSTRPSVSRELMKMQADGLIEIKKNNIKILDLNIFDEIN